MNISKYKYLLLGKSQHVISPIRQQLIALKVAENQINSVTEAPSLLQTRPDLIFCIDEGNEDQVLAQAKQNFPGIPVVSVISGDYEERVVELMQNGIDYLVHDQFTPLELIKTIHFAIERNKLKGQLDQVNQELLSTSRKNYEFIEHSTKLSSEIIYDWDLGTNTITWGKSMTPFLGHQPQYLKNIQQWVQLIHPDDRPGIIKQVHEALSDHSQSEYNLYYRLKKADGTYARLEEKMSVIKNEQGNTYRAVGVINDITRKIEAEQKVKTSDERYSMIFNEGPVAMLIFNIRDLKIIEANKAAMQLYEYELEECQVRTIEYLFQKSDIFDFLKAVSKVNKDDGPKNLGHWKNISKSGVTLDIDIVAHGVHIDGEP
ncbi:MAG: PAS domain-containing protein, partial [Fulvivirga sp.]|nr:PAS domain-containing protein [Fulvivirga sp.]